MSLKPFYQLDRSYAEQLDKLLHDERYVEKLLQLQGSELEQLVDYLSDTMNRLIRTGGSPRKCLHILRKISSAQGVLPSTYEISGTLSPFPGSPVAHGGFGEVQQGSLSTTRREDVCIKKLRLYSSGDQEKFIELFCKEAIVWKHLNHPNIVPFKGVTLDPPQLVSEWMPGGELRRYLKNNPSANLVALLLGVAEGLSYLHSHDIIHGDLKGPNIVVDASGNARLTDFGFASIVRDPSSVASTSDSSGYTPRWTAPEIFRGHAIAGKKSDIFSFAMVMFEVFSGKVPFPTLSSQAVPAAIMNGERPFRPAHASLTDPLWKLTQKCWKDVVKDRPEIEGVIRELKEIKFVPPLQKPRGEPPVATQGPSSIIVVGKQPVREQPLRTNVDGGSEATPYDVDVALPDSTPLQQKGARSSPVPKEIKAIADDPPSKTPPDAGHDTSPGNGPEAGVENGHERRPPAEDQGQKELKHRRSRKGPGGGKKARGTGEDVKNVVVAPEEKPPDLSGSSTPLNPPKPAALPPSPPATRKPSPHRGGGKDPALVPGSSGRVSVEGQLSPPTPSPKVHPDSGPTLGPPANPEDNQSGVQTTKPFVPRPGPHQVGTVDQPHKSYQSTPQNTGKNSGGPALPSQLPTYATKQDAPDDPPPQKSFLKKLLCCLKD